MINIEEQYYIVAFRDPTLQRNHCKLHCELISTRIKGLFFHRDFSTWNSRISSIVRMVRVVLGEANRRTTRTKTWTPGMMGLYEWNTILALVFDREALRQVTAEFAVIEVHPISAEMVRLMLDHWEELEPSNGDEEAQAEYESWTRVLWEQECATPTA